MDNQTGGDRNRDQGNRGDQTEGNFGKKPENPAGTSGRDADLQKEGNLGNEKTRGQQGNKDDESQSGDRQGQDR